ncbi:hypothetical protein N474_01285 [Pseudoalteromonas luteoviolacea CPMOR-2]|nr:hypothetical protein N474_01285 [Pseudoalteromonas luteoviolacea CPMOR-2]
MVLLVLLSTGAETAIKADFLIDIGFVILCYFMTLTIILGCFLNVWRGFYTSFASWIIYIYLNF